MKLRLSPSTTSLQEPPLRWQIYDSTVGVGKATRQNRYMNRGRSLSADSTALLYCWGWVY